MITVETISDVPRPTKYSARWAVKYALQTGRLIRGGCAVADRTCHGRIEAHHDDYSRPLAVTWLCQSHHQRHHNASAPARPRRVRPTPPPIVAPAARRAAQLARLRDFWRARADARDAVHPPEQVPRHA